MEQNNEKNLGIQPVAEILKQHQLKPHDLVEASTEQLTHKMVTKAVKGRRLTNNVQMKILRALSAITEEAYSLKDLFNY